MSTIINGSSPSVTFSDGTTQASAGLVAGGTIATGTITNGTVTTLTTTTISDGTNSTSATNPIRGSAKAWVKGSVSAGVPTINGSFNISSITKVAGGVFTFALTNAMPNANYSVVANGSTDTDNIYPASSYTNPFAYPSTTTAYTVYWFTGGVGVRDPASINTAIFS